MGRSLRRFTLAGLAAAALAALLPLSDHTLILRDGSGAFHPQIVPSKIACAWPGAGGWPCGAAAPPPANLLTDPNNFTTANWTQGNASQTGPTTATTDPNGGTTASEFIEDGCGTACIHKLFNATATVGSGATVTEAIYVKQHADQFINLVLEQAGDSQGVYATIDTSSCSITQHAAFGGATDTSRSATSAGNGWCLVKITGALPATTAYVFLLALSNSSTPGTAFPSYTSNGSIGVYIFTARMSLGTN